MDRVICPKISAAATCPIPMCKSCQLWMFRVSSKRAFSPNGPVSNGLLAQIVLGSGGQV